MSTDVYCSAVNLYYCCCVDAVVIRCDVENTACNVDITYGIILIILCVETILVGPDGNAAVCYCNRVIGFKSIRRTCDVDCTAGDFEIVLTGNAIVSRRNC